MAKSGVRHGGEEAIGVPEAARLLGTGYFATRELLFRGVLTGEKRGNRWVVGLASVEAEMARRSAK